MDETTRWTVAAWEECREIRDRWMALVRAFVALVQTSLLLRSAGQEDGAELEHVEDLLATADRLIDRTEQWRDQDLEAQLDLLIAAVVTWIDATAGEGN